MKLNGKRFHEVRRALSLRTGAIIVLRSDGEMLRRPLGCDSWEPWRRFKKEVPPEEYSGKFAHYFRDAEKYQLDAKRQPPSASAIMRAASPCSGESLGFCVLCGHDQGGCEPDARGFADPSARTEMVRRVNDKTW